MNLQDMLFVELDFGGSTEAGRDMVPRIWQWVHLFNWDVPSARIGVDLPGWRSGTVHAGPPDALRLLGPAGSLEAFMSNPVVKRLRVFGLHATPISPVPAPFGYAMVRRDNNAEKCKPSHARRMQRRGLDSFVSQPRSAALVVPLTSRSNNQVFNLRLRKTAAERNSCVSFTSYGLTAEGALPQF